MKTKRGSIWNYVKESWKHRLTKYTRDVIIYLTNNGRMWADQELNIKGGFMGMFTCDEMIQSTRGRIKFLRDENRVAETSKLIINHRETGVYYYEERENGRKGITYDMERVHYLARCMYSSAYYQELKDELKIIEQCKSALIKNRNKSRAEKLRHRFAEGNLDMRRVTCNKWQLKCVGRQSENPYNREELIWESDAGIFTRSKSERDYCNRFDVYNVPFQYEKRIMVDMTGMEEVKGVFYVNGRPYKYYYPDFVVFCSDGSILIIEHLGRLDMETYRHSNGEKLIALLVSGYISPDHLILTTEMDMRDLKTIDRFIEKNILPRI